MVLHLLESTSISSFGIMLDLFSVFFFVVTVRDIEPMISTSVCFSLEYNNATEFLTLIL